MPGILIVEDEPDLAEVYRLTLEGAGYTILGIYADPAPALEDRAKIGTPDIIILDERLGLKSGTEELSRFRDAYRGARIVLISADPDAVRLAEALGFDEGKCKPVPMLRLLANFAGLLQRPCRVL
jgi:DNA-binding response OmpR family regulator